MVQFSGRVIADFEINRALFPFPKKKENEPILKNPVEALAKRKTTRRGGSRTSGTSEEKKNFGHF